MKNLKKEDVTIIGVIVCWSENSQVDKLKHKQYFSAKEFEDTCKKQDELINSEKNRLGYDKTKYQVVYFVNSERDMRAKSYTDRVDLGDGKEYIPTEDKIKETILNIEQRENKLKDKYSELEM